MNAPKLKRTMVLPTEDGGELWYDIENEVFIVDGVIEQISGGHRGQFMRPGDTKKLLKLMFESEEFEAIAPSPSELASGAMSLRKGLERLGFKAGDAVKELDYRNVGKHGYYLNRAYVKLPPLEFGSPRMTEANQNHLIDWGWTGQRLMDVLLALDLETIPGLTEDFNGTTAQWAEIVWQHPDTWRVFVDDKQQIVGNWHFVPLHDAEYEKARQGTLRDSQITLDRVVIMNEPGWYKVYFLAIFLLPAFRRVEHQLQLQRSILKHLAMLARNGIFCERICANAYTQVGQTLCTKAGFQRVVEHQEHGTVYELDLQSLPEKYGKDWRTLRELYALGPAT